jgi:N-acyl-D-amino-acid deacylase
MRSEANELMPAVEETLRIGREAHVHAEIYHFKAAGQANWPKMATAIARIEQARKDGLSVGACMYSYEAAATGLEASMPRWIQEGGHEAWIKRLKDPALRARAIAEMKAPPQGWENMARLAGSPDRVKLVGFKNKALKPLTGKTLAEVAAMRGVSPEDAIIDLVIEDDSRVETVYFLMSEDNIELGLRQPWVSLCSDSEATAPEGVFLMSSTHPRTYGNFARFLGHYVRDKHVTTLPDAIRRLTRLPAETWKLSKRGCIDAGCFADVVVFDPARIAEHATYDQPMQFATGVRDVFVNGVAVVTDGKHTGAKPGRVVRGPGYAPQLTGM